MVSQIIVNFNNKSFNQIGDEYLPKARTSFLECFAKWHEKDTKLPLFLRKFTATGMYLRAIHECLGALEKLRMYQDYVDIVINELMPQTVYGHNYRGRWCIRSAIIYQSHLKNQEMAIHVCRIGLNDFYVRSGNHLELFMRLIKMVKIAKDDSNFKELCPDYYSLDYKENIIYADYQNIVNDSSKKNFFSVTLSNGEVNIMSVENIVINHYLKKGYSKGIHCESSIYHTFLGLLFWDCIYSLNFEDSFRYNKQILPLDLNYDSFYEQRKNEIDDRILEISKFSELQLISELALSWNKYYEKASLIQNWDSITLHDIQVFFLFCILIH